MTVNLVRLNSLSDESVLERSYFKLLFDIKPTDSKSAVKIAYNPHNNEVSFRQPYSILAPEQDIKTRVGQLSSQPWGFVKSYAEGVIISAESKKVMDKIEQQLPKIK